MIEVYTGGSRSTSGVGSGIAIFINKHLTFQLKYKLAERCSNNQAEQLAIAKALEKIQDLNRISAGKSSIRRYSHRQQDNTGCNSEAQKSSKFSTANKR